jgi:hypothetical protein
MDAHEIWERELEKIEEELVRDPLDAHLLLAKGDILAALERNSEATLVLERLVELYPLHIEGYLSLEPLQDGLEDRLKMLNRAQALLNTDAFEFEPLPWMDSREEHREWYQHTIAMQRCGVLLEHSRTRTAADYMLRLCEEHPDDVELNEMRHTVIECIRDETAFDRYMDRWAENGE